MAIKVGNFNRIVCFRALGCGPTNEGALQEERQSRNNHRLRKAAGSGNIKRMQRLIDGGADIATTDRSRLLETPLHKAAKYGMVGAAQTLLRVPMALRKPCTPNQWLLEAENIWGQTPLHLAASRRREDMVEALLREPAADVNRRDHRDHHPATAALMAGSLRAATAIVDDPRFNATSRSVNEIWRAFLQGHDLLTRINHASRLSVHAFEAEKDAKEEALQGFARQLARKSNEATLKQMLSELKNGHGQQARIFSRAISEVILRELLSRRP